MRPRAVVLVAAVAAVLQLATPTAALVVPAPAVEALTHPKATTTVARAATGIARAPTIRPVARTLLADRASLTGIDCGFVPYVYLNTVYGPIALCTRSTGTPYGRYAQAGFLSGITGQFGPITGYLEVIPDAEQGAMVAATDGYTNFVSGGATLATEDGPGKWATQLGSGGARWGTWNRRSNTFSPTSGWTSVAPR